MIALSVAAAGVGILVGVIGFNTLARYNGWTVERLEPAALSAMLAPHYTIARPPGDGPFPTALLFSGCDGPGDNIARWSKMLNARGWAAIGVDSHTPRGYLDLAVWRLICTGQLFMGSERAGDVLVALADARAMPFVDPGRMALVGMSHGGWAIMELLAFDPPARLPFNLAAPPPTVAEEGLDGVLAAILVYPWCGPANRARRGWDRATPTLFLLATDDYIAPAADCIAVVERLRGRGVPVVVEAYDGVTHGFDQSGRSEFSPLRFDPEATAAALARAAALLEDAAAGAAR